MKASLRLVDPSPRRPTPGFRHLLGAVRTPLLVGRYVNEIHRSIYIAFPIGVHRLFLSRGDRRHCGRQLGRPSFRPVTCRQRPKATGQPQPDRPRLARPLWKQPARQARPGTPGGNRAFAGAEREITLQASVNGVRKSRPGGKVCAPPRGTSNRNHTNWGNPLALRSKYWTEATFPRRRRTPIRPPTGLRTAAGPRNRLAARLLQLAQQISDVFHQNGETGWYRVATPSASTEPRGNR